MFICHFCRRTVGDLASADYKFKTAIQVCLTCFSNEKESIIEYDKTQVIKRISNTSSKYTVVKEEENNEINQTIASNENETNSNRFKIYRRDGFLCYWCGTSLLGSNFDRITLDHIYPTSLGGRSTAANLVTSCNKCNCKKHQNLNLVEIGQCLFDVNQRNQKFGVKNNMTVRFDRPYRPSQTNVIEDLIERLRAILEYDSKDIQPSNLENNQK